MPWEVYFCSVFIQQHCQLKKFYKEDGKRSIVKTFALFVGVNLKNIAKTSNAEFQPRIYIT